MVVNPTVSSSTRQIARAATLVMALFLLSRIAGLAREMIISGAHCTEVSPCGRIAASAARMSVETVVRSR